MQACQPPAMASACLGLHHAGQFSSFTDVVERVFTVIQRPP
jgi:hypothetical protein